MKSLRFYLITVLLSAICLCLFLSALHGYRTSISKANILFDNQLIEMERQIESLLTIHGSAAIPENFLGDQALFQVYENDTLINHSTNANTPLNQTLNKGLHFVSYQGKRWRILIADKNQKTWIVGRQADAYQKITDILIVNAIAPVFWSLPVLGIVIWIVISLGLKPLNNLATLLRKKSSNELSAIDTASYPNELLVMINSLNQFMEDLRLAYDRERRFASDAAHELRTPIAALKVGIYNLEKNNVAGEEILKPINDSINKLANAVEQILILHKLSPDTLNNSIESFDITEITQEIIINLYDLISEKDQQVDLIASDTNYFGSRFGIQTLIKNLIENSIKYTPIKGKIRIKIEKHNDQVRIEVEDSGPGIPESDRDRIFDRFYRVGGDRHSSKVNGSGLGLSIVKDIVALHRGNISVDQSMDLGGLRIAINLPALANQQELE